MRTPGSKFQKQKLNMDEIGIESTSAPSTTASIYTATAPSASSPYKGDGVIKRASHESMARYGAHALRRLGANVSEGRAEAMIEVGRKKDEKKAQLYLSSSSSKDSDLFSNDSLMKDVRKIKESLSSRAPGGSPNVSDSTRSPVSEKPGSSGHSF